MNGMQIYCVSQFPRWAPAVGIIDRYNHRNRIHPHPRIKIQPWFSTRRKNQDQDQDQSSPPPSIHQGSQQEGNADKRVIQDITNPSPPRPPQYIPHIPYISYTNTFRVLRTKALETRDSKTQGRLKTPRYPLNFSPHVSHAAIIRFVSSPANSPTARSGFSRDKEKGGKGKGKKWEEETINILSPLPPSQYAARRKKKKK